MDIPNAVVTPFALKYISSVFDKMGMGEKQGSMKEFILYVTKTMKHISDGDTSDISHLVPNLNMLAEMLIGLDTDSPKIVNDAPGDHICLYNGIIIPFVRALDSNILSIQIAHQCWKNLLMIIRTKFATDDTHAIDLIAVLTKVLEHHIEEFHVSRHATHESETHKILLIIELLSVTSSHTSVGEDLLDKLFQCAVKMMMHVDDKVVGRVMSLLLPSFFSKISLSLHDGYLRELWETIIKCFGNNNNHFASGELSERLIERPVYLMCASAEILFPTTCVPMSVCSLLRRSDLWNLIQVGLFNQFGLTRKRSMYLLKRILNIIEEQGIEVKCADPLPLFWWTEKEQINLARVWENLILLIETLEEKQLHVIKPVFTRFQILVQACSDKENSQPLLHTSWLSCVTLAAARHDSNHVQRWIVQEILTIDYKTCPFFEQQQDSFLCGAFLRVLSTCSLYHKPSDVPIGRCSPVADSLCTFFQNLSHSLPPNIAADFFTGILKGLCGQYWSGTALVYIVRGLASVARNPILDDSVIHHVRELLINAMATIDRHFRAAIQNYVVRAVLHLIDEKKISLSSFCVLLGTLKSGVVFQRGNDLEKTLVGFVTNQVNKWQCWTLDSIKEYLVDSVKAFLKKDDAGDTNNEASDTDCPVLQQWSLQLIRLLLVVLDSDIMITQDITTQAFLKIVMGPVLDILMSVNSHAYMPVYKPQRAIMLLTVLSDQTHCGRGELDNGNDTVLAEVSQLVSLPVEEMLLFIEWQISENNQMTSLPSVDLYCRALWTLGTYNWKRFSRAGHMVTLIQACCNLANTRSMGAGLSEQLSIYSCVSILATISDIAISHQEDWHHLWVQLLVQFMTNRNVVLQLEKPKELKVTDSSECPEDRKIAWGKVASCYLAAQWSCMLFHFTYAQANGGKISQTSMNLDMCLQSLDLVSADDLLPVMKSIKFLLTEEKEEYRVTVMEKFWRRVKDSLKNSWFKATYAIFLEVLLTPENLQCETDSPTGLFMKQIVLDIFSLGAEKSGMVYELIKRLCAWVSADIDRASRTSQFHDVLGQALVFGPVHSKGKRFINEVNQFILNQPEITNGCIATRPGKEDAATRVEVLSLLARLKLESPQHMAFAHSFLRHLIAEYLHLKITDTHRSFPNSLLHRQKHRIFVGILLLQPFVEESISAEFFSFLLDMLQQESQPSLRCMIEWLVILMVNRWDNLLDKLWYNLAQGSEKKAAFLCSHLSIICHIGNLPMDNAKQVEFFNKALPLVLPWCMAHHFNIRVHSQATILSLWNFCKKNKLDPVLQSHSIIEAFVTYTERNKNACKNTFKLMDHFFFKFHPLDDYSVETVVLTMPLLTGMTDEEWIPLRLFTAVDNSWLLQDHVLPLYNKIDTLKHCTPGTWRVRRNSPEAEDEEAVGGDVQKKMIPWRAMLPETELDSDLLEDYGKKRVKTGGLVLVTSLINKIPNLGGLCRTGEIFGVSEFVIGNLSYTLDQQFQSLSVSAHKWVPIKEVRPEYLSEYLLEMKDCGYTLVGAEQTAQSKCLTEYVYPEKTLLLLGNEKEGIPVELIQLLDVCVEIPQQGIIRSLNVHVSGALLIWEYTRQQLQKQTS